MGLVGCAATEPHADKITYSGTFGGMSEVRGTVTLPKDLKGKSAYLAIHRQEKAIPEREFPVGVTDSGGPAANGDEFLGLEFWLLDFEQSNNPEVIALITELNKAIAEQNTERVAEISALLGPLLRTLVPAP